MKLNSSALKHRSTCSISCALEILGDKWTLLIIRDALYLNSTSFGEFRSSAEKIASNILTDRLEKLVKYGVFKKTQNQNNKLKFDYTLTNRGRQLEPVLLAIGKWGYSNIKGTNDVEEQINKYQSTKPNQNMV